MKKTYADVEQYRPSMVTAIGIILGFVLGFSATWATGIPQDAHLDWSDYSIGIGLLASVCLLLFALYRMLDNRVDGNERKEYFRTVQIFIGGVAFAFVGLAASILQIFLVE
jgi:UDP-N-acetylmuramyl pentapeptide phosphotransferase/UDP-N-acetylglucosamine-1-phosphate transferase